MCYSPLYRVPDEKLEKFWQRYPILKNRQIFGYREILDRSKLHVDSFNYVDKEWFDRVPCGSCLDCRLSYSKAWAVRCVCESRMHPKNTCWFVTITYDDEHLPSPISIYSAQNRRSTPFYPLVKKDIQLFIKRLRKSFSHVRYYACGEYGSKSKRPHFHLLLFGLPLFKLIQNDSFSHSEISDIEHYRLFESQELNDCWRDSNGKLKGLIAVAPFSYDSACYTARYCMKKLKGEAKKDFNDNFQCIDFNGELIPFPEEFVTMSLKPGIGASYLEQKFGSIYSCDDLILYFNKGINHCKPPRYFDTLAERLGVDLTKFKDDRKFLAESQFNVRLNSSGFTEEAYYDNQKELVKTRSNRLVRALK